jgi:hypothetical protein
MEYVISYYVPVLFEEDTLETIGTRGFVQFHGIKGS